MWFSFACVHAWVSLFLPTKKKKKILSRLSPSLSGTYFTATCTLGIPKNHLKGNGQETSYEIFLGIWSQTADVVSGLWLGRGIWVRECSGIRVCICGCVCIWKGEAVIILVCTAAKAEAPLWHATWLHSICSNPNKNPPGVHGSSQTQRGHKPP